MKNASRSMGPSTFLKNKKVNTKNFNKCFGGKMYIIIMNRKTWEKFFFIPDILFVELMFYRLIAKMENVID